MNRRTSAAADVMFVAACINVVVSVGAWIVQGESVMATYAMSGACLCLLMAVLMCVYPRGRA